MRVVGCLFFFGAIYTIADRFFDFAALKIYQETFDKPKDSVYRALYAFSIIGMEPSC